MEKTILKFPKNDSVAYYLTINKIEKELDSAYMTVKENHNDTEPLIKKSLGAGISLVDNRLYKNQLSYKIQLDGADTQDMEVGVRYFFDIKGTIGNAQKTFRSGELILSETATGYLNPATTNETTMISDVLETDFATGAQSEYVETEVDPVAMKKIGDMTKLDTTEKGTIVKAINEVNAPTFTEATTLENVVSGEKQSTLWGKVKKCFSSLKALAFKDKVGTEDFAADAKCPNATVAQYASADTSKGTIEQRLANLGFKSGNFAVPNCKVTENTITRQGNYVIGKLTFSEANKIGVRHGTDQHWWTAEIPINSTDFYSSTEKPLTAEKLVWEAHCTDTGGTGYEFTHNISGTAKIANNKLIITSTAVEDKAEFTYGDCYLKSIMVVFGYEADAIQ